MMLSLFPQHKPCLWLHRRPLHPSQTSARYFESRTVLCSSVHDTIPDTVHHAAICITDADMHPHEHARDGCYATAVASTLLSSAAIDRRPSPSPVSLQQQQQQQAQQQQAQQQQQQQQLLSQLAGYQEGNTSAYIIRKIMSHTSCRAAIFQTNRYAELVVHPFVNISQDLWVACRALRKLLSAECKQGILHAVITRRAVHLQG